IQHNIMAMNAYRNYTNNTSALSKNLEKLSSGYKINRAGDDAAGLAISEKMRAQITGLETAQKNAKDGISLVQTAEGALTEVHDMLNRMVELADQSANGTYDNEVDRDNLNKELEQLKAEINRIADSSNFNGIKLLNGNLSTGFSVSGQTVDLSAALKVTAGKEALSFVPPSFSVDLDGLNIVSNSTQAGSISLTVDSKTIKLTWAAANSGTAVTVGQLSLTAASITIGGVNYNISITGGVITFTTAMTAGQITAGMELNPAYDVSIASTATNGEVSGTINAGTQVNQTGRREQVGTQANATLTISPDMVQDGASIKIGDEVYTISYSASFVAGNANIGLKDLLTSKGELDPSKMSEVVNRITQAAQNNADFTVGNNGTTLTLQVKTDATNGDNLITAEQIKGAISVTTGGGTGDGLVLQIGDTSDSFNQLMVDIQDMHTTTLSIDNISIADQKSAQDAIKYIKEAINTVSSVRGTLGATQNRLDHTINNLSVMTENIQDAESTIRDTDVAEEMMAYTKNNILVQSAQA
ncbi:hypothetical protein B5F35_18060, partial [Anaeromassilibacillus sp. An200]